ncbi:hypothetical protein, partial [Oceanobacillus jordanicus]
NRPDERSKRPEVSSNRQQERPNQPHEPPNRVHAHLLKILNKRLESQNRSEYNMNQRSNIVKVKFD